MTEEVHVALAECDLPEPYVACLEVRQAELWSDSPPPAVLTLYLTTGYPYERIHEWLRMRLETINGEYAPDEWGEPFQDGDDWLIRTWVRVHEVPSF